MAKGHAQLPPSVLQSLKLQQHGRLQLQSMTSALQIHPHSITLHPMPYPSAADSNTASAAEAPRLVEELSPRDLKQLLAAWLTAQAAIIDPSQQSTQEPVPVLQGSVVQLTADDTAEGGEQAQSMAFQIRMKQPPSLLQAPNATYALLSAADLVSSSSLSVSQGDPVVAPKWAPPKQVSLQLEQQQAAMLSVLLLR